MIRNYIIREILFSFLLLGFTTNSFGNSNVPDSLIFLFNSQLSIFPQEKIYVHTDKPYYISGERIWLRAYLTDAVSHIPASVSRYVYVELIDPLDSIVTRVKIRQDEGVYHGHLLIPDDVPEGDYTLRAYTTFMRSQDENYFFTKNIHIGDPQAKAIHTETQFFFESDSRVQATFRLTQVGSEAPVIPQSVKLSVNDGKSMNIDVETDGTANIRFNMPASSRKRIILLETVTSGNPYRQFIQVPVPDNDFDVAFFPEGGSLMIGTTCNITFKAMKSNGQSTDITGVVYDESGQAIQKIESDYLGMGNFSFVAEKEKTYYAVCENYQGQSKHFNLPTAFEEGFALSVNQTRDRIYVSVLQPAGYLSDRTAEKPELYLLAHTRGILHLVMPWDYGKNQAVIKKEQFPSGALHFILFDAGLNPVSERLVFINNHDQTEVSYRTDREKYAKRSLVQSRITLTDSKGEPLEGSFSVAVTSDSEVLPDSTSNILTYLLLTSDLRGTIENPAYYFQNNHSSAYALDLLMRTQGWRRYDFSELTKGNFSQPTTPIEASAAITGVVESLLSGRSVDNIEVIAMSNDGKYFSMIQTDKNGRFSLYGCELPENTGFIVRAEQNKGISRMNLIIDEATFPERTLLAVPPAIVDKRLYTKYADKAEQKYLDEQGIRIIDLSEVTITAERKPKKLSKLYAYDFLSPNESIIEEEIDKYMSPNIFYLLNLLKGVIATTSGIMISRCNKGDPLLIVDDVPMDIEYLDKISTFEVAQIDVINCPQSAIFGMRGDNGAIVIFTKDGSNIRKRDIPPFHIKTYFPLGYQQPVEFYAPKYDTAEKVNASISDYRTTIHWQPVVQTDSLGVASFEFYTADEPTSYTVIIQGIANDGRVILHEGKVWIGDTASIGK